MCNLRMFTYGSLFDINDMLLILQLLSVKNQQKIVNSTCM